MIYLNIIPKACSFFNDSIYMWRQKNTIFNSTYLNCSFCNLNLKIIQRSYYAESD